MATIKKRKGKKGTSYQVIIRIKGYPTIYETFHRLTDAREFATKTEAEIRQGQALRKNVCQDFSFKEAVEKYFKTVSSKKSPTTQRREKETLKRLLEFFVPINLHEITPEMVANYRDKRLRQVSGTTVRQELTALSHIFQVANNEWGLRLPNPAADIKRPAPNPGRIRFLSQDEASRLLKECQKSRNKRLYPYILLLLHTGMRPSEAARLRWDQIDLERGVIVLHVTKTKVRRVVPLTETALKTLAAMERKGDYVFLRDEQANDPVPSYRFRGAFESALKRAGIKDFRMYDLRHTAASYLLMAGVDIRTLAEILGHRTLQMVMRYTHLLDEHKKKAINTLNSLGQPA